MEKMKMKLSPTQIIALTFAVIILTGALLLTLPIASRDGISCGFRGALFTATSATCSCRATGACSPPPMRLRMPCRASALPPA